MTNKSVLKKIKSLTFPDPKEYCGAVAMLDALGTRERDASAAREYLEIIQVVVNDLVHFANIQLADSRYVEPSVAGKIDFDILAFGDTLVISAGVPAGRKEDSNPIGEALGLVGSVARDAVYHGIQSGILLRG